jgi:hypothetical protein
MNLYAASRQWASRPADERFWTLEEMLAAAVADRERGLEKVTEAKRFRAKPAEDDIGLTLVGQSGGEAGFTNFSFGQLCRFVAPVEKDEDGERRGKSDPEYLCRLPARIAADALNHDLAACPGSTKVLWDVDRVTKTVKARSFTTPKYGRMWNEAVIRKLIELKAEGWRTPPGRPACNDPRARPATEADCLLSRMDGLGIQPGDTIAPCGLYKGEKDMFAFMVNEGRPIDAGGGSHLFRGFFAENSEVGNMSYWITEFLYNSVCGNHIVWGARDVKTTRVVHIGDNVETRAWAASEEAWGRMRVEITEYANDSVSDLEAKIKAARVLEFGKTKDEVVDFVYGKRIAIISRDMLENAYDLAEQFPQDSGNAAPTSKWGMVQGLTRLSQQSAFADKRVEIDKAAGKVMELAVA